MTFKQPVVNDDGHRPIDPADTLDPSSMPVAPGPDNALTVVEDGLYVQAFAASDNRIFVDTAVGVDAVDRGTRDQPVQTLAYALTRLNDRVPGGSGFKRVGSVHTVMLKVGQTFALTSSIELVGTTLRFGFWGDARGDWDTPILTTVLEVMSDVSRPVINNVFAVNPNTGLTEASRIYTKNLMWNSTVEFHGVQVNLAETSASSLGVVDLVDGPSASLVGSVINKTGHSPAGFMAIRSTQNPVLRQFASQFRVTNRLINKSPGQDGITVADLEARTRFIKFYLGIGGANYQWERLVYGADALNSSNASGLLQLLWEDSIAQLSGGVQTTASYPLMSDLSFGVGNYFMGLRRDQQGRVINVLAGRLI